MKAMLKRISALVLLLLVTACSAQAQVTGQGSQPEAPQDRAPASASSQPNDGSDHQPIALRILGANLRDSVGAPVGRIENLIVDPNSGQVDFLIVSPFFPTNGSRMLAIPWKAISYRADQNGLGGSQIFALTFPRTKLQQAPSFERYRWPDMTQEKWRQTIYSFYSAGGTEASGATPSRGFSWAATGSGTSPERQSNSPSGPMGLSPAYSNDFIGPHIQSATAAPTNSPLPNPADRRRESSTPDNSLPVGARFGR